MTDNTWSQNNGQDYVLQWTIVVLAKYKVKSNEPQYFHPHTIVFKVHGLHQYNRQDG